MIRSVAVIGVGSMGAVIAHRLQQAGFELTVCDVNEAVLAGFEQSGARVTRSPADCADVDLVLVLVANLEQTRAVLLGPDGLRNGLTHARSPVIAVMSTVPVEVMQELDHELASQVAGLIDAPFSGGLSRAERGTLTFMVGGEHEAVERVRPVLSSVASEIIRCGELGAGQAMKIVNNIVGNASVFFAAEAYRIATHMGLDLEDAARAMEAASGRSFFSANPTGVAAIFGAMVRDRASFDGLMAIIGKDVSAAAELAARLPGQYPAIAGLKSIMESVGAETYENWLHVGATPSRHA